MAPPTKNIQSAERDVVKDHLQSYLRAVVKVWRFPPVAPVAAAVVVAAVLVVITYEKIILTFVLQNTHAAVAVAAGVSAAASAVTVTVTVKSPISLIHS